MECLHAGIEFDPYCPDGRPQCFGLYGGKVVAHRGKRPGIGAA
ncbi:MAG: hypothetical protein WCB49_09700 [Gammaproteobacteria bacterium]